MKIVFDKSGNDFLEFRKTETGNIIISISAQDSKNPLSATVNSVEITLDKLKEILEDLKLS